MYQLQQPSGVVRSILRVTSYSVLAVAIDRWRYVVYALLEDSTNHVFFLAKMTLHNIQFVAEFYNTTARECQVNMFDHV